MRRNVIAIVGAAGAISGDLRRDVERMARKLADAGFDLVTGGMDGVMRAVARGHGQSAANTQLLHIEPGWGRAWERNPHPASVVRTNVGSMRNYLVVRSADLVVAVSGGAGTLSEIAVAWQEGKPIAALRSSGGWSATLAGTAPDHRRGESVVASCDTVEEVLAWATRTRPEGVFAGRMNQGFYPLEAPAIHRVYGATPDKHHRVQLRYGMSIGERDLVPRLEDLNGKVERWNQDHDAEAVALVTFDDGWRDATRLVRAFDKLPCLCPVLFVGENHFRQPLRPLPLQRLYHHCADRELDPEDPSAFGAATRTKLKALPEAAQHAALDEIGIAPMFDPAWLLSPADIADLKSAGWIVASHGHCHEDMPKRTTLREELAQLADSVEQRGHMPWLAWPEGLWSRTAWQDARKSGFHLQFGLRERQHEQNHANIEGMVFRSVWT